jgi:hypothetical protein
MTMTIDEVDDDDDDVMMLMMMITMYIDGWKCGLVTVGEWAGEAKRDQWSHEEVAILSTLLRARHSQHGSNEIGTFFGAKYTTFCEKDFRKNNRKCREIKVRFHFEGLAEHELHETGNEIWQSGANSSDAMMMMTNNACGSRCGWCRSRIWRKWWIQYAVVK